MEDPAQRGRLAWRCRRGMKELDLLLREYLDQHWAAADSADRDAFARLLELPDPELASYLLGHADATDITLEPVLAVLRGLSARRTGGGSAGARGPGAPGGGTRQS
ncbi:MAG: succinate dehydrogenase assembly factor 2 [Steroidobacteraceae bacterium]